VIFPVPNDPNQQDRAPARDHSGRPVRRLRREVLAAARNRGDDRVTRGTDDPWLESWRKLLAKYRRR